MTNSDSITRMLAANAAGELLYFAARANLGDALFDAARQLTDGKAVAVSVSGGETHLLVMIKNQIPRLRPFDAARSNVYADYKADQEAAMLQAEYEYLRSNAAILIAPENR